MILLQDLGTGYWVRFFDSSLRLRTHSPDQCEGQPCAIHGRPSAHPLADRPLNWREDRGILERICKHKVGHPDMDSARYLLSIGQGHENTHGCDGCCVGEGE